MSRLCFALCLLVFSLLAPLSGMAADRVVREHTTASLASESSQIARDQPFWVLFQLDIKPGWHTYWKNPGDSGLAPQLSWTLPEGVTAGDIVWQPPHRQPIGPMMNYGYSDVSYHLVRITPPEGGFKGDALALKVQANWLVCEEECIPEDAELDLTLPIGANAPPSGRSAQIAELERKARFDSLPITGVRQDADQLILTLPLGEGKAVYFFPDTGGVIEPAAAQTVSFADGVATLSLKRGLVDLPPVLSGLLEVRDDKGLKHYAVTQGSVAAKSSGAEITPLALGLVLLSALAGGIILNAMPCVFPVLSLKALSLSRASSESAAHIRNDGLAYTAGVVTSFAAVGAVLLIIKAGGTAAGWGFQMQSPLFVAFLIYLLFLIGLNLSGLFEIGLSFGGGQSWVDKGGLMGAFVTGALATLVANPCTAPFMAAALGAALTLPAALAMLIFIMLGLGLALPYLLLCLFPALLRRLPKPGPWMETFRQLLAFPMYLTVLWLVWVLAQQAGLDGAIAVVAGLIAVVFAVWLFRKTSGWKPPVRIVMVAAFSRVSAHL